jgi:spermidine synthase
MPHEIIDRAKLPDSDKEMVLLKDGDHVCISVGKRPLMSSDVHDSEDMFGSIAAQAIEDVKKPRVLIGGLGLGFTLRAALDRLPKSARLDVAELVPEVVKWNKGALGKYAKRPLRDKRVKVHVDDVANVIAAKKANYDLIALDVDNGPAAMTQRANENLYRRVGLTKIRAALKPGGVLAVWSSFPSRLFTKSLEVIGSVELVRTPPSFEGGPRYYIWLARR